MNECVLVVDDDREIVRAIAVLLEKEGYQVLKAYDGLQALELAVEKPVQLIIMDVMMPRLDGLSAVMKIRERKNIPIIVLSAKSEETDKILGLSMGADDYVAKPFHPQELAARVKSQLAAGIPCWVTSTRACPGTRSEMAVSPIASPNGPCTRTESRCG